MLLTGHYVRRNITTTKKKDSGLLKCKIVLCNKLECSFRGILWCQPNGRYTLEIKIEAQDNLNNEKNLKIKKLFGKNARKSNKK